MTEFFTQYILPVLFGESYLGQIVGFVFMAFAWRKAYKLWRSDLPFRNTRKIAFILTTIGLVATAIPALISVCYFLPECFEPWMRNVLRIFNGNIIGLYGFFKWQWFYTKEPEFDFYQRKEYKHT